MTSSFASLSDYRLRAMWIAFLATASVIFSFFFACGSPFAALATAAVLTLSLREALAVTMFAWLVNQTIGFGLLGYPQEMTTFIWGGVLGAAAVAAVIAAKLAMMKSPKLQWVFPAAFVAHQFSLYLAALTPLGGLDGFTFEVIARVASVNLLGLAAFYLLNRLASALDIPAAKARLTP